MESTTQLAAKLLADGYRQFIGKGLVIEQAQKQGALLAIDGAARPLEFYDYRDAMVILPVDSPPPPMLAPQTDFIHPDITDSPPGSFDRLEALASYYVAQGENGSSAFTISDNAIAKRVASALVELDGHSVVGDNSYDSKHYRSSTVRE